MKKNLLLSVLIILSLSSFRESKEADGQPDSTTETPGLDAHKWYLTTIYQPDGFTQVMVKKTFVSFQSGKGSAGGNGGCNSFGCSISLNGQSISFTNIFSTKMYCAETQSIENDFFNQLGKVDRYEIKDGCLLLFRGDQLLLEFIAE